MARGLAASTRGVCPACLRPVPAERVRVGRRVWLRQACPEHGVRESLVWSGRSDVDHWVGDAEQPGMSDSGCPNACGLCPDHLQESCCVLLEVTKRCDLRCRVCFADAGDKREPARDEVIGWVRRLTRPGKTLLQVSGGEPTLRDDLPEIVAAAREAGCPWVQLNTNGLRLASDAGYVGKLAEAGLSFVFLQFDGTTDEVYRRLRGRPLLDVKERALANCASVNLGVTLVPTLVPGINLDEVGAILAYAVSRAPAVRGVHFQPVSYMGRVAAAPCDAARLPLDELVHEIESQTAGGVRAHHLQPSRCDHPLCGFHGDFLVGAGGRLVPLAPKRDAAPGCCAATAAEQSRRFVARRWLRPKDGDGPATVVDLHDMESFLARVRTHGFTVTAMAFQDAGTLDVRRLRRCSLHVFENGRLVPFCAHYLSRWPA